MNRGEIYKLVGVGSALLLGAAACGGSKERAAPHVATHDLSYEVTYYPDGSRKLTPRGYDADLLSPIIQWCDGGNLEQESFAETGGNIQRGLATPATLIPNFAACRDGRLTRVEFAQGTSAIEQVKP